METAGRATWSSTNAAVATVSSTGLVTAVAAGDVDISAIFQGVAGQRHLSIVRPSVVTLKGTITDATSGGVLPGIAVLVTDSAGVARTTTTDGTGFYTMAAVPIGVATITLSATGYTTTTTTLTLVGDTRSDIVLSRKVSSSMTVQSTPGDYILDGKSLRFDEPADSFRAAMVDHNRTLELQIWVRGVWTWDLTLSALPGQQLSVGTYQATLPFQVDFSGDGRGCGQTGVGEMTVFEAEYAPPQSSIPFTSGRIARFHATFVQRCHPTSPPLVGEVWLYSLPLPTGR